VSENSGIKGLEFAPKNQLKLTSFETCFSPSVSQTLRGLDSEVKHTLT